MTVLDVHVLTCAVCASGDDACVEGTELMVEDLMLVGDELADHKHVHHDPRDIDAEPCCVLCCTCGSSGPTQTAPERDSVGVVAVGDQGHAWHIEPCDGAHVTAIRTLLADNGWALDARPSRELLTLAGSTGEAIVAVNNSGHVIGYARIVSDGELVSYLAELVVDEDWRRCGIARALVDRCMKTVPTARLDLLSTQAALGFYVRIGCDAHMGYRKWP